MKKCKYCGTKIPNNRKMCKSHECYKASRREYYQKNPEKFTASSYSSPAKYTANMELVKKELNGELSIQSRGGLFEGCTPDQIRAMKSGNFKEFMELED